MQQTTTMNSNAIQNDTSSHRFKYGGGAISLLLSAGMTIGMVSVYEEFTSPTIEWHLFSTKVPIIIPNQVMIGLWWVGFLLFLAGIIMSLLPKAKVVVGEAEITAQGLLNRKFTTIVYKDILDLTLDKNYVRATDRNNNKIYLSRMLLSSTSFQFINEKLRSSATNAL